MEKKQETRWIKFLGGKNLLFTLVALLLLGAVIFIFHQVMSKLNLTLTKLV